MYQSIIAGKVIHNDTTQRHTPRTNANDCYQRAMNLWSPPKNILATLQPRTNTNTNTNINTNTNTNTNTNMKVNFGLRRLGHSENMIVRLLKADRKKRLGCGQGGIPQVKLHKFFLGVDWNAVLNEQVIRVTTRGALVFAV